MSALAEETTNVAVARQPIFDRAEAITGFEILYRSLTGPFTDAEGATSTVIVQSLADIGLERLVGDSRAFINVTADFLLKVRPLPMPPERVVLELVGTHSADPALLGALRDARDAGFKIALDGFRLSPGLEPLLALANVVKLDIRALSGATLVKQVNELRGRGLTLIALKVESREEYEACRAMGFDGFQGYFFAEPAVVSGPTAPTHRLGALTQLIAPDRQASFEEIERVISQDAGLAHKLVRLASSAFVGTRTQVASVRQALILLGTVAVRRWAMLLALSGLTDRPSICLPWAWCAPACASCWRARILWPLPIGRSPSVCSRWSTRCSASRCRRCSTSCRSTAGSRTRCSITTARRAACSPPCSRTSAATSTTCRASASACPRSPARTARRSTGPRASPSSSAA